MKIVDLLLLPTCEDGKVKASAVERSRKALVAKIPTKRCWDNERFMMNHTAYAPMVLFACPNFASVLYSSMRWLAFLATRYFLMTRGHEGRQGY